MSDPKDVARLLRDAATLMQQMANIIDYHQASEIRLHDVEADQAQVQVVLGAVKERLAALEGWAAGETIQAVHGLVDRRSGQDRRKEPGA